MDDFYAMIKKLVWKAIENKQKEASTSFRFLFGWRVRITAYRSFHR